MEEVGFFIKNHTKDIIYSESVSAVIFCSSYRAEMIAINRALEMLRGEDPREVNETRICTDSQSAINRLKEGASKQKDVVADNIWQHLTHLASQNVHITFQWVPSHCGIEGNEKADEIAKLGSNMEQRDVLIDYNTVIGSISRSVKDGWINNSKQVNKHYYTTI